MLCLWFGLLELMLCTLPCMNTGWPKTKTIMSIDIITNHKKPKLAKKTSPPFASPNRLLHPHRVYFFQDINKETTMKGAKTPNQNIQIIQEGPHSSCHHFPRVILMPKSFCQLRTWHFGHMLMSQNDLINGRLQQPGHETAAWNTLLQLQSSKFPTLDMQTKQIT